MPRRLPEALVAVWLAGTASAAVVRLGSRAALGSEAQHSSETLVASAIGTAANSSRSNITPTLKPKSDPASRGDYVHDISPRFKSDLKFGHPYPLVQDNGDYDHDFVKDENDDSGEWRAQMDYDTLRIKIEKLKAQVQVAKAKESEEKQGLDSATAKEAAAQAESEKAEKAAVLARQEHEEHEEKLKELQGREGGKQVGGKIAKKVAEVNKEIADVEECQRQLKEAQAQLKAMVELKQKREEALEEAKHQAGADHEVAEEAAQAAMEAKYKNMDDDLVDKIQTEEKDYNNAVEEFRMDESEMKKTQAELDRLAAQLRKSRQEADPEGGVYPKEEKSVAASSNPQFLILAVASIAASCCTVVFA